jgi:hypothetical protein
MWDQFAETYKNDLSDHCILFDEERNNNHYKKLFDAAFSSMFWRRWRRRARRRDRDFFSQKVLTLQNHLISFHSRYTT